MFQCKEMFSFVEKLKKGSWINVQCIVILWCFVMFIQKKNLISPTKLSNLGMIKPSTPSKILPQRSVHPTKKNMKNACSEEFDPATNFSPFLFPPEILFIKHLLPTSRGTKGRRPLRVWRKMRSCPEVFIVQKINTSNKLSIRLWILTFELNLSTLNKIYLTMLCSKATLWTSNQSLEGLCFLPKQLKITIQLGFLNWD